MQPEIFKAFYHDYIHHFPSSIYAIGITVDSHEIEDKCMGGKWLTSGAYDLRHKRAIQDFIEEHARHEFWGVVFLYPPHEREGLGYEAAIIRPEKKPQYMSFDIWKDLDDELAIQQAKIVAGFVMLRES